MKNRRSDVIRSGLEALEDRKLFSAWVSVLDSSSASPAITRVGIWTEGTNLPAAYNGNQLVDSPTKKGQQRVIYTPSFPAGGKYQVYGWWRSISDRSTAVPFIVNSDAGNDTVLVNERVNAGKWNLLGTYNFSPGGGQGVTISNTGTTGSVVADAIRFVQVESTIPLTPENLLARPDNGNVRVTWVPGSTDQTSFQLQEQTTPDGPWSTVDILPAGATSWVDTNPAPLDAYRIRATNETGSSQYAAPVRAWAPQAVGNVTGFSYQVNSSTGVSTLAVTGGSIGGTTDSFGYGWQKLSGDGQIVVRVASLTGTSTGSAGGVMFRQSLSDNSPSAAIEFNRNNTAIFTSRTAFGAGSSTISGTNIVTPRWLKLVRVGDVFTAFRSVNGTQWNFTGRVNIPMGTEVYVGLTGASRNTGPVTVTFDNVTIDDTSDDRAGWTRLFNGTDLQGLYTYTDSQGVNNDTRGMFKAGDGLLKILDIPATTAPVEFGYVATTDSYSNYRLRWEYKWDSKKFNPRQFIKRDSGVLFNFTGNKVWPAAPEFQVQEQDTGDAWLIGGVIADTNVASTSSNPQRYTEGGIPFTTAPANYRQLVRVGQADTTVGWNRCELIVSGDDAVFIVNGVVVNKLFNLRRPDPDNPGQYIPITFGKILFQAEGAAVTYRNIEIRPLGYTPAPPGATVLYNDPSDLSNWRRLSDGSPANWAINDGAIVAPNVAPEVGSIRSNQTFGDFQAHIEFRTPFDLASKTEQLRGNSGIYLQGRYEVQILDSWNNVLQGQNDVGAIYDVSNPSSNPALPAETWQSMDIAFRAAKWSADGQTKLAPARISVTLNGVLVQDFIPVAGPTALGADETSADGPLVLQSHWSGVRFRNIWITPGLPPTLKAR